MGSFASSLDLNFPDTPQEPEHFVVVHFDNEFPIQEGEEDYIFVVRNLISSFN